MRTKPVLVVFLVTIVANLVGVLFFFKPIADGDTSLAEVHPLVGLLAYAGMCTGIYFWAYHHVRHSYRAAFVLILPQAALVLDLAFRGDRGFVTALAGIVLLSATWLAVGYAHALVTRRSASTPTLTSAHEPT